MQNKRIDTGPMFSPSQKYVAWIEDDPDHEIDYFTTRGRGAGEQRHQKDKFKIVKIARTSAPVHVIIHQYKMYNTHRAFHGFISCAGTEWFIGGRHYLSRLFVNCETGEVRDEMSADDDAEELDSFEFIWCSVPQVSPSGHFMLMEGCMWSFPYERRLYDIRNLIRDGAIEIEMQDYCEIDYYEEYCTDTPLSISPRPEKSSISTKSNNTIASIPSLDLNELQTVKQYHITDIDLIHEFVSDNEIIVWTAASAAAAPPQKDKNKQLFYNSVRGFATL